MKPARLIAILLMVCVLGAMLAGPIMCVSAFSRELREGSHITFSSNFSGEPVAPGKNVLHGDYESISQAGPVDIEWVQDSSSYFDVSGEPSVIKHIKYNFDGSVLKFGTDKVKLKDIKGKVKITVHGPQPESFELAGKGSFMGKTFKNGNFDLTIAGSGDVTLQGNIDDLGIEIAGTGNVKAASLKCKNAKVEIAGKGDVDVDATTSLSVEIAGFGTVKYHGDPKVSQDIFGKGEIVKAPSQ